MLWKTVLLLLVAGISIISFHEPETRYSADLKKAGVIDWHVHVAGLGYGDSGNFINDEMRNNFRFDFFMKWMDVTEEELAKFGDAIVVTRLANKIAQSNYIDKAVVLALDGVINEQGELDRERTQFYVSNEFVSQQTREYENLLFAASINPTRPNSIELLNKVHAEGAVLIKWIPSIMHFDPSDPALKPFYERMAELNMPLLSHTGMEKSFANARDELADPKRLQLALESGVKVIAAHIATTGESDGQDNFERILPMFNQYDNLYTDISSLTQINKLGYLRRALDVKDLQERMIYGTDWPLQYFPITSPWYHVHEIGFMNAWRISHINNVWDRDIELKRAYGVNKNVFIRAAEAF